MKTKGYLMSAVLTVALVVILFGAWMMSNSGMVLLSQEFPEIPEGRDFQGELLCEETDRGIPVLLTDEQYQLAFSATQVKEKGSAEELSFPAFVIRFTGTEHYEIFIGADGRICVTDALQKSSRFFLDRSRGIFRSLYEQHLASGGTPVPGI